MIKAEGGPNERADLQQGIRKEENFRSGLRTGTLLTLRLLLGPAV